MAGEIGKRTITVPHGGETYEFRIPSIHDDIKIGARVKALYRKLDPEYDGDARGLDFNTQYQLRLCGTFEILLLRSSASWPFAANAAQGTVACDTALWRPEDAGLAGEVFNAFSEALGNFRAGGNTGTEPAKPEDLAGKPNPESQPVQ